MRVQIQNLKAGDVIAMHGGTFCILEGARPALDGTGPSPIAVAQSVCLTSTGTFNSYFWPGSSWTFQGHTGRAEYNVINRGDK